MSATLPQPKIDEYLASQSMPNNEPAISTSGVVVIDPDYLNVSIVTPVGRFLNLDVTAPRGVRQKDGSVGPARYGIGMIFAPGTAERPIVADIYRAVAAVAKAKWPSTLRANPQNLSQMVSFTGEQLLHVPEDQGGLHYPLRDGNNMYQIDPVKNLLYFGTMFINASMYPKTKAGADQRPTCFNERGEMASPEIFYRGCYGRARIRVAHYENMGNKGVTFYLESVQFAKHGDRIGGHDGGAAAAAAFAKAGALPPLDASGPGFGPNTAGAGSVPAGFGGNGAAGMTGFASPPSSAIPPQGEMPASPLGGGFRPPGT